MQQFPSAKHLSSWAGVCPGNNRSAGKNKSSLCTSSGALPGMCCGLERRRRSAGVALLRFGRFRFFTPGDLFGSELRGAVNFEGTGGRARSGWCYCGPDPAPGRPGRPGQCSGEGRLVESIFATLADRQPPRGAIDKALRSVPESGPAEKKCRHCGASQISD